MIYKVLAPIYVLHVHANLPWCCYCPVPCVQIQRPVPREEFVKWLKKTLNVKLSPAVLDVMFYMFADGDGCLDGPGFVDVMKRRNRVPGYKVRVTAFMRAGVSAISRGVLVSHLLTSDGPGSYTAYCLFCSMGCADMLRMLVLLPPG